MIAIILSRVIGALGFAFASLQLSSSINGIVGVVEGGVILTSGLVVLGMIFGLLVTPYLLVYPLRWFLRKSKNIPTHDLFVAIVGLLLGLIISLLLSYPLSLLPYVGGFAPILASIVFGFMGVEIMLTRERDLVEVLQGLVPSPSNKNGKMWGGKRILVDTSAIIDGRMADISQTGFVQGELLIPRFVLDELQRIADSSDALRRNRGRRGLEMLNKLRKESKVPVRVVDVDFEDTPDVDAKLVKLAQKMHCYIITNDFNLNRVAEIQGISVLNVNELANAVRSVVMPGEEMVVRIIQEGKEHGQGVGYLDDGTMVVVEGGRRRLNSEIDVVVTRVLQTAAGRMIFGQPKGEG